ncbi:hypothetical protein AB0O04_35375, partial [Streptomyces althioticus]|uniref:TRADD-N-associated membrane domain-containing protein n=1 Tax=Streptomyces althioticus TaxID=83380 RepID=UPI003422E584
VLFTAATLGYGGWQAARTSSWWEVGILCSLVGFAVGLAHMASRKAGRDSDISESRERVREAELNVRAALGGDAIINRTSVVAAGDVTLPSQGSGVEEESLSTRNARPRQERHDLALSSLWELTHAQLELYHKIATTQAKRSFNSAQASMIVGFVMLAVFVVLAVNISNTTGAIVAGGLGAVSAALAGFISKTFVKSQETAAEHLKAYFDQPLEFSRYLAAERLLTDANLPEEKRAEVVAALVQTIAAGPGGPAPAADPRALLEQLQDLTPGQQ